MDNTDDPPPLPTSPPPQPTAIKPPVPAKRRSKTPLTDPTLNTSNTQKPNSETENNEAPLKGDVTQNGSNDIISEENAANHVITDNESEDEATEHAPLMSDVTDSSPQSPDVGSSPSRPTDTDATATSGDETDDAAETGDEEDDLRSPKGDLRSPSGDLGATADETVDGPMPNEAIAANAEGQRRNRMSAIERESHDRFAAWFEAVSAGDKNTLQYLYDSGLAIDQKDEVRDSVVYL